MYGEGVLSKEVREIISRHGINPEEIARQIIAADETYGRFRYHVLFRKSEIIFESIPFYDQVTKPQVGDITPVSSAQQKHDLYERDAPSSLHLQLPKRPHGNEFGLQKILAA